MSHFDHFSRLGEIDPYVTKEAYFGAKMAVFGPNIQIILEGSKNSGTHVSENHLGTSFIVSLVGQDTKWIRKAIIRPKSYKKYIFWAKFGCFWANILNFYGRKQKFWHKRNETRNIKSAMRQRHRFMGLRGSIGG